jgi:hypothetical protein
LLKRLFILPNKIEFLFVFISISNVDFNTCSMNLPNELCDMNLSNEICEMNLFETNLQNEVFEKGVSEATSVTGYLHNPCITLGKSSESSLKENQEYSRQMIFGSFHQSDARFSQFSRGSQCTCMALTMLIKCYEGFSFTSEFLDQTIVLGDQIYRNVVESLQRQNKFLHKLLKFDELPQNVTLGENHHFIEKCDTLWGLVVSVKVRTVRLKLYISL